MLLLYEKFVDIYSVESVDKFLTKNIVNYNLYFDVWNKFISYL